MISSSRDADYYNARRWGFLGAPFKAAADDASNRIAQRIYLDERKPYSFQAADWRTLPKTARVGTTTDDTG